MGSDTETNNYYATINAPATLTAFRARYMVPTFGDLEPEVTATYYNDGDLGIGREMHCRRFAANASHGAGVACHVSNYGTFGHTFRHGGHGVRALAAQQPGLLRGL